MIGSTLSSAVWQTIGAFLLMVVVAGIGFALVVAAQRRRDDR